MIVENWIKYWKQLVLDTGQKAAQNYDTQEKEQKEINKASPTITPTFYLETFFRPEPQEEEPSKAWQFHVVGETEKKKKSLGKPKCLEFLQGTQEESESMRKKFKKLPTYSLEQWFSNFSISEPL